MPGHELFELVIQHREEIIKQSSPLGEELLKRIIKLHPADIAELFDHLEHEEAVAIFVHFPREVQVRVFHEVHHTYKILLLESLSDADRSSFMSHLSIDDLTDFFDDLSDDELKNYLKLLHRKDRERVVSLLKFDPESAGGIMYTDVVTLMQDFTVEKSIHILQRLRPSRALHQKMYVTNQNNELVGHINLEDLVLKSPKTRISSILRSESLIVRVDEDRQDVANNMVHYGLSNVPVVGIDGTFLGAISSQALIETIEEEASEDIYRMSALSPIKYTYFETPFLKSLYQRSSILIILLLLQTFSSLIVAYYEKLLCGFLTLFMSMLISTGGNASSQTSALAIQGMATGEIDPDDSRRFIRREFIMATLMGLLLGLFSFIRMYGTHQLFFGHQPFNYVGSIAVSLSLMVIVIVSIVLGSSMPFVLRMLRIDPAYSAGPVLTTIIDVIGLLIYCLVSSWIFKIAT